MRIIPVQEVEKDLQIPKEKVVESFTSLVKAGKIEGFYDSQGGYLIEYTGQDLADILKIVEEKGPIPIAEIAKEMVAPLGVVEQILRKRASDNYIIDNSLVLKKQHIVQSLKEAASKNGRAEYVAVASQLGISKETIIKASNDFLQEFIKLRNNLGVTTWERLAMKVQEMSMEDPSVSFTSISEKTGIIAENVQPILETLIKEKKLDGSIDYAGKQYLRGASSAAPHLEVNGGFEVIGEFMKAGIKIANQGQSVAIDCSVTLEGIPEALILTEPTAPYLRLGNIRPGEFQSAIYKLKPSRCVDGSITGVINYYDYAGERHTVDVPPIRIRNICPFLTSEGVVVDEFTDVLKLGLLPCSRMSFHFNGPPKTAMALAEQRVRQLIQIDRDEKVVEGTYCGYACYMGNAKYGGYMFATEICVSGTETHGQLTVSVYSNEQAIVSGYIHEVMEDVRKHIETTSEIALLTGKCPECGGEIDPQRADEKGFVNCNFCRCLSVIPPWMRINEE